MLLSDAFDFDFALSSPAHVGRFAPRQEDFYEHLDDIICGVAYRRDRWVYRVPCGLIHLLLVLAVISLIVHSVTGRDGLMIGLSSEKPHRRKAAGLYQHSESITGTNRSPSLHP
jgi:hypothetical protein